MPNELIDWYVLVRRIRKLYDKRMHQTYRAYAYNAAFYERPFARAFAALMFLEHAQCNIIPLEADEIDSLRFYIREVLK